jgi:lipopolysaccharide export system ATP-binding protein
VADFFSVFRRGGSKRGQASRGRLNINLQSLGGAIGRIRAEPMRLPNGRSLSADPKLAAPAVPAPAPQARREHTPQRPRLPDPREVFARLQESREPYAQHEAVAELPNQHDEYADHEEFPEQQEPREEFAEPHEAELTHLHDDAAHFLEPDEIAPAAELKTREPARDAKQSAARKIEALAALAKPMLVPAGTKELLSVHSVEKSYVGRRVVKGVSLYVRGGEAVGLLGPNGAGKTTVFYMITGLIAADRGRIELDGYDVTKLPMYQRARLGIGYLPQEASIFRGLNVEDNIRSVLEIVEPNRRKREAELDSLLEEFNITRLRKSPSIALSGGERRRVEIARALATRPRYMLLDEPFAGIDPIAVGDIQVLVKHLTKRGIGVLITDHNVRETLGLTDRGYIIFSGEVLMEGRPDDIVNHPEVRRLYLGEEFRM